MRAHLVEDEVVADALEGLVWLGLQDEDDVAGRDAQLAHAGLTAEHHLGAHLVPLLYVHLEHLALRHQPLRKTSQKGSHSEPYFQI